MTHFINPVGCQTVGDNTTKGTKDKPHLTLRFVGDGSVSVATVHLPHDYVHNLIGNNTRNHASLNTKVSYLIIT